MDTVWLVSDPCDCDEWACSGWGEVLVFANEQVANQYAKAKYGEYWQSHVRAEEVRTKLRKVDGFVY